MFSMTVYVDGNAIPKNCNVISVRTASAINGAKTATLELADGRVGTQDFAISDSALFDVGKILEIHLGYGTSLEEVFKGKIVKHRIELSFNTGMLHVECEGVGVMNTKAGDNPLLKARWGVNMLDFIGDVNAEGAPVNPINPDFNAEGRVSIQGTSKAQIGSNIEIEGVGNRLSGPVLIYDIEHTVSAGHWTTGLKFYKCANETT